MIRHLVRVVDSLLRERKKRKERSPKWRSVEKAHLAAHPECAACPGKRLLQVHHVIPFHVDPSHELDPSNLITLCMGPQECHRRVGHRGSWTDSNPNVVTDAAVLKAAWKP